MTTIWRNGRQLAMDRGGYLAQVGPVVTRSPMTHELKVVPPCWEETRLGRKPFEFRLADRDFRSLDKLVLKEWDPVAQVYTGREWERMIGFILDQWPGLSKEHVILGLVPTVEQSAQKRDTWTTVHPAPPVIPKDVIAASEALQAQVDKMRAALMEARDQFLHYAELHQAKGTEDGLIKAQANRDHANLCAQALL